ncbi:Hypothetical protein, putative [Bodo saltans]|uniref:Uncharacterized protein n=1 Tax=Bodo saltans TaxID=75058 RepID=A0A0S4JRT3_BODSA|nr:Hypothetical protein, putative [Bodo saltans]|eukprot:CUG92034.1 Hypothetical protein, putative [Bodo saltans]
MKAKQEVTVLKKYLKDNAAHYADSFTEADLSKADSLFVKYAKRRGKSPVYIESSRATPKEEEDSWDARCRAPWDANNKPQEFVGFWLMRQYPSRDGIVRNSKLNGADADLVEAVAQQFGVPLWHIECRVVYHYDEGKDAKGKEVESVFADFVEGVDDYPRDYYSIAPVATNDDTEVDKKGEFDDDDDDEGEDEKVSGLRAIDHEQDNYDQMYGHQYRKVAIVGGSCGGTSTYVGLNVGNDAGDPIYRYHYTYLYFHVKYLKDYLARQAATRSDSAELPCPASGVAKKRAREEEEEGNL